MENKEVYYTYMVRCSDGSLYTGWTVDLERRLRAHNGQISGGAKYTAGRRPVFLVWNQCFTTRREAQVKECALKRLSRAEKEALLKA